mgnify:CR=1 FL=1
MRARPRGGWRQHVPAIVGSLRSVITRFSSLAPADRLRAVAVSAATATVGHLMLLRIRATAYRPGLAEVILDARLGGGAGLLLSFLNA